jgi:SAM-dependent methyltransferase
MPVEIFSAASGKAMARARTRIRTGSVSSNIRGCAIPDTQAHPDTAGRAPFPTRTGLAVPATSIAYPAAVGDRGAMTRPSNSHVSSDEQTAGPGVDGVAEWDARYAGAEQVWSGRPNTALLAEVVGLPPGRALDVGCGEGADAVWLARQGWDVTALDVSRVALERATRHARDARVEVRWIPGALEDAPVQAGAFDLVSALYPALRRTPTNEAETALTAAVAPGGVLLVVHHADVDSERARAHGFDPADYVSPTDVAALLDGDWQVAFDGRRPRDTTTGAGAHHTHDVVLRARRLR